MMKGPLRICLLMCSCISPIAIASELNIYLWEDTLSKHVISQWTERSGIALNLYQFDNDDERSLLMLKSVQLPFDLIVLDNVSAQIFSRLNAFEDLSHLKNRKNNEQKWNDICGSHAIPYFWGSVGILYRKSKLAHPPKKWSDFIDPEPSLKGHIGMIEDSIETLLPAMYAQHFSPISASQPELKKGFQIISAFNHNVLTYEYALSYVRSHQENDELYMALAYSGDQSSLNKYFNNNDWGFVTPEGKPYLWIDCMAINSNSKHKKEAKAFLNYLMEPEVAAQNTLDIGGATPNKEAFKLLPKAYREDISIFPEKDRLDDAIIDAELSPENLNLRAKIINNIINQYEAQQ
jgi:spermidine/putrescine transport system substrate-binding protein